MHIHSTQLAPLLVLTYLSFFSLRQAVTMIDCRQWCLVLLPYEGTALNLIDIKFAMLDLRRKPYSGSILFKKIWAMLKN